MRNLKKVLALVMAMALTLTMFAGAVTTVPKASDYDTLSASAQEAVSVLTALGVINGYPDGTFKGDTVVTRAELAKMIYVMKTGDASAAAGFYANADLSKVFKDSVDSWAVPYINYCYLNSIIVGYEDSTVRANNPVTGVEAAKIALVALGYVPKTEGLEGSGFYSNTMRLASVAGLLKNVAGNMAEGMTRADTAILLYNALYANTVQYVGGAASAKTGSLSSTDTITLGEEGFDLLDVTGVLVANDEIGLSAYWKDVLNQNTWNRGFTYKAYDKAASGQSRFVYKDYVAANAANPQGYYEDKVVTANVDTSVADLGRKYRMLITKPSTSNYSSTEIRTVYGIIGEVAKSTSYDTTETSVGKIDNDDAPLAMYARYKAYYGGGYLAYDVAIDGTVYLNGKACTFKAAETALSQATTAPVTVIDNDKDGTPDHLFIAQYTLGVVSSMTDTGFALLGAGTLKTEKIVLTNGDVANGDYVAWYKNEIDGLYYVKKLTAVTSNISGYNGSKYSISGTDYTQGSLYTALKGNALEGYNSVNSAIYTFYMDTDADNNYIAASSTNEQTSFEKYAIMNDDAAGGSILGQPQVKLYTEDNEYVYGVIASINGEQVYDYASYQSIKNKYNVTNNDLVSYIKNGNSLYLYTANYNPTNYNAGEYFYNSLSDTWSEETVGAPIYKNENGVVFVSFNASIDTTGLTDNAWTWRAYSATEFRVPHDQPAMASSSSADLQDIPVLDVTIATGSTYGVKTIKAAAFAFDYDGDYTLPGISSVAGSDVIATITAKTNSQFVDGAYVYTYSALNPWNNTTTSYTTSPSAGVIAELAVGSIYRLFLDSTGKIERYELMLVATNYTGTTVTGYNVYLNSYGTIINVYDELGASFYVDYTGAVHLFLAGNYYTLDANTNVYFAKKIGTPDIATVDWAAFVSTTYIPNVTGTAYRYFVEFDASTGAINNLWIDVAAPTVVPAP